MIVSMPPVPSQVSVLSFEEARHAVEEHARKVRGEDKERLGLLDAAGRVLAEALHADRDFPPFARAARDGYAVRAADLVQLPASLRIIGEIKAGAGPDDIPTNVARGEAVGIMTGAPAPPGSDAVVMVEYTSREGATVNINKGITAGENIVPAGSEAGAGDLLAAPGTQLDEAVIAVAASIGKAELLVYRKPTIAIISTGDEVVPIDVQPGPTQIRNSNTYSIAAQVQKAGSVPVLLSIAPDEPTRLSELIREGLRADLLLLAGGVSMGKYDLVEEVLAELKAEFFFTGAQIQPGRPIVFGRVREKYFFGLPGNPVSTMVTFELFVRPMLDALSGRTSQKLTFLRARLKSEIKTRTGLKRFLPGILSGEFEHAEVELSRWRGSGDIASTARANCYVVIPPDRERIPAGEWVPIMLR
jgi:molybdopterin molybdotransferase